MLVRSFAVAALVAVLLVSGLPPVRAAAVSPAPALLPHAPISILGNAGFNATNGVVSGTGTAADPYVIEGWVITAPPAMGVQIRGTNAHAVVRDVVVTTAPVAGFYAYAASNVTLSNVTALDGSGEGIRLESCEGVEVAASNVTQNLAGVVVLGSGNVSLVGNNVTVNAGDGAMVSASSDVLVQGNRFAYDSLSSGYGLDLTSSTNVTVRANRFTGNGIYLDGAAVEDFASHTITADNLVSGLPILYVANHAGFTFSGVALGELLVANCAHVAFSNLTTSGADLGVEVAFSSEVVLGPNVTISDSDLGLRVVSSAHVAFADGEILRVATGASIESSSYVGMRGTKVSAPYATVVLHTGVAVSGSYQVNLTGNVVRHYPTGVSVDASTNVSLVDNAVSLDTLGVVVTGSLNTLAIGNLVSQDATGLLVAGATDGLVFGNAFEGAGLGVNVSASSGLRFVHNAFLGNREDAVDANGTADAWDGGYPVGGNFWSTYSGVDEYHGPLQNLPGPDGIGDTSLTFNVSAVDRYPLMADPVASDAPPEALFGVSPPVGTPLTAFTVSANASSDYEDALSALQVRWDWESNGTWTPWTGVKFARHVFPRPGVHEITLEVRDRADLTDTWTVSLYVAPKPDNLPPAIVTTPPASADVGVPLPITANITDPSGVENATLLYRGVDGGPFEALPMRIESGGTNFTATIPAQPHAGTLAYVIVANDTWANEARAPLDGYSVVPILDPVGQLLTVVVLPVAIVAAAALVVLWWRRRRRAAPPAESPPAPPSPPPPT